MHLVDLGDNFFVWNDVKARYLLDLSFVDSFMCVNRLCSFYVLCNNMRPKPTLNLKEA